MKVQVLIGLVLMSTLAADVVCAAETAQSQTLIEVKGRPAAPLFSLQDMEGKLRSLEELRGKVVVLNFWATWCPPCRREMPSLERLSGTIKNQEMVILAVNVAEDFDTVFSFLGTLDPIPTFPIVFDRDGSVLKTYPVRGLPTTFVLDAEGRTVYRAVGGREFDDPAIVSRLKDLIRQH